MKQPLTQNSDVKVQPGCTKKRTGVIIEVLLLWNLLISFGFSWLWIHTAIDEGAKYWDTLKNFESKMEESVRKMCNWKV